MPVVGAFLAVVVLFVVLQLLPSPPLTVHESDIRLNGHNGTNALLVHALWRGGLELG